MSGACDIAARLRDRRSSVLLHSGGDHDGCGTWSFVACDPIGTMSARGENIAVRDSTGTVIAQQSGDPALVLQNLVAEHCATWPDGLSGPVPVAIGYMGYELGAVWEPGRLFPRGDAVLPDLWFGLYDAVWRRDEKTGHSEILARDSAARRALAAAIEMGDGRRRDAPRLAALRPAEKSSLYRQQFGRIREYIRAGDVYQVNLARALTAPILRSGDALALYESLAASAPAEYGAVLSIDADGLAPGDPSGAYAIISGSPERFVFRRPGSPELETRPIKGTRRRTGDRRRDRMLQRELESDEKEGAEHLMIVDLLRNDLGRVAQIGSVNVTGLGYTVELPHLYHLVSRVSCRLRPGVGLADIVRATFPGGSITGAPKIRAMEIIAELETRRRGPYTGAIGYFGLRGAMDLSIAIRTAVLTPTELTLSVGGGIVADSTADREFEETEEKAAGWRRALAGCSKGVPAPAG